MKRTSCNICENGHIDQATEVAKVRSNVRQWKRHQSTVWRCTGCGSLNSLELTDLKKYYTDYPFKNRKLDFWSRVMLRKYVSHLKTSGVTKESRILDYGCSEGLLLTYLKEKGFLHLSGYDAYIDRYSNKNVLQENYDAIILQDVIEHVEDPNLLLDSLNLMLCKGGRLIVGTPCADQINLADPEQHIHSLHQPYHLHILSEKGLSALAKKHGFILQQTIHRHTVDTLFPFTNWTFMHAYLKATDNCIDTGFEPPQIKKIFLSPKLLYKGLLGYFSPISSDYLWIFSKH